MEARTKNNWVQVWGNMNGKLLEKSKETGEKLKKNKGNILMLNPVSSSFPRGVHSAAQTELHVRII